MDDPDVTTKMWIRGSKSCQSCQSCQSQLTRGMTPIPSTCLYAMHIFFSLLSQVFDDSIHLQTEAICYFFVQGWPGKMDQNPHSRWIYILVHICSYYMLIVLHAPSGDQKMPKGSGGKMSKHPRSSDSNMWPPNHIIITRIFCSDHDHFIIQWIQMCHSNPTVLATTYMNLYWKGTKLDTPKCDLLQQCHALEYYLSPDMLFDAWKLETNPVLPRLSGSAIATLQKCPCFADKSPFLVLNHWK